VDDENPSCSVIHFLSRKAAATQTHWRLSFSSRYPSGSEQARTNSCLDPPSTCTDPHQCSVRARLVTSRTVDVRILYGLRVVGHGFHEPKPLMSSSRLSFKPLFLWSCPYPSELSARPFLNSTVGPYQSPASLIFFYEVSLRWYAFFSHTTILFYYYTYVLFAHTKLYWKSS